MKKKMLKKYAELIATVGVNVRHGQEVIIRAELDQPEFVSYVVECCYKAGAKSVTVDWKHQPLEKMHVKYRSLETLSTVEDWEIKRLEHRSEILPATLYLISEDPDGLIGMDQEKNAKARQQVYKLIKPISDRMENKYQWCIAAVPGKAWAKKVFPNDRVSVAVEKLWNAILRSSRADVEPISAWDSHNRDIKEKCDKLNSLGLRWLEYKSSNGTDLKVGLIPDALFAGGMEYTIGGTVYNPNIPSEEIFTTPMKGEAEGIVYSSMPLSYNGELIEDFSIRFENGKAVELHARKNEALLKQIVEMDENAGYLGECALVPYDSPIRNSGILFYNTLFDENASCHLALGMGFTNCIKNYSEYTIEECREKGINDSQIHVDFMIGTQDLSIMGYTEDGRSVPIFKDGGWAI